MLQIFATEVRNGERFEITDLYWFEENFVHTFMRALDVCPVCEGKGKVANTHGVEQFCIPCDGTGQRQ